MQAGRSLDALVAEKVMGWAMVKDGNVWGHQGGMSPCPHYSTSIEAAWEVVDFLQSDKFVFRIQSPYCNIFPGYWTAMFGFKYIDEDEFVGRCNSLETSSESAPHAICLGALKAVEATP